MKRIKWIVAACLLFLAPVSMTNAATIGGTTTTLEPNPYVGVEGIGTPNGLLMQLAQFDPKLGTLASVVLKLEGTYHSVLEAEAGNSYPFSELTWNRYVSTISIESGSVGVTASSEVTDNNRYRFFSDFNDVRHVTFETPKQSFEEEFSMTDITPFVGTGFIDFFLSADTLDMLSTMNVATLNLKSTFTGKISALYEYTPVPLSTAAFFLISGLLGLLGFRQLVKRVAR